MKRIVICLLALAIILPLSSCGKSEKNDQANTTESVKTTSGDKTTELVKSSAGENDTKAAASSYTESGASSTAEAAVDVPWKLAEDGTLTIYESVASDDQAMMPAPWFSVKEKVKNVIIKSGASSVGSGPFAGCTHLKSITVEDDNVSYSAEDGILFNKDKTTLICFPAANKADTYVIPDGVTVIADSAFYCCRSLKSVTIPNGVTSIGSSAFFDCANLLETEIPESVKTIGGWAFLNCTALAGITVPDNVKSIGSGLVDGTAFYNDETNWKDGVLYIGNHLISSDINASGELSVRRGTLTIADMAFSGRASITGISIPESAGFIGANSFTGCDSLKYINVDEKNKFYSSSDGVLFDKEKTSLLCCPTGKGEDSYAVPDGVESIADKAFSFCALKQISLPASVKTICDDAFYDCESLTAVVIPDGVTSVGNRAFYNCVSLSDVTVPESVTFIGDWAFAECSEELVISCPAGSYAEQYAKDNGIGYVCSDLEG